MQDKLSQILASSSHPLRFLVNANTGNWISRFQLNELGVHAGHRDNFKSCEMGYGEMSLALELGWDNSSFDSSFDKQAASMGKPTVTIEGVEIDLKTAKWLQKEMRERRIQETKLKDMNLEDFVVSDKGWQPGVCK
jgi:hypothetical protein